MAAAIKTKCIDPDHEKWDTTAEKHAACASACSNIDRVVDYPLNGPNSCRAEYIEGSEVSNACGAARYTESVLPPALSDPGHETSLDLLSSLAGTGDFTIEGHTTDADLISGRIGLGITDFACEGGCELRVSSLEVKFEDFSFGGQAVTGLSLVLPTPVNATGVAKVPFLNQVAFTIPSGTDLYLFGQVDGYQKYISASSAENIVGIYDPTTGEVTVSVSAEAEVLGHTLAADFFASTVAVLNRPPTASAGEEQEVAADGGCGATVQLDGSASSDPDDNLVEYIWTSDGQAVATGENPEVRLDIGEHEIELIVFDAYGSRSSSSTTVTVTDDSDPEFSPIADVTILDCTDPDLIPPTVTDNCASGLQISNDAPSTFSLGNTVVTWTVQDEAGNIDTVTQTVTLDLGNDPSCCPSGSNVIQGTTGNDVLNGTPGVDCILGDAGNDVIAGNDANDAVSGWTGNDVISGGGGNDWIYGGDGDDTINSDLGDDYVSGGAGTDVCSNQLGTDVKLMCEI